MYQYVISEVHLSSQSVDCWDKNQILLHKQKNLNRQQTTYQLKYSQHLQMPIHPTTTILCS